MDYDPEQRASQQPLSHEEVMLAAIAFYRRHVKCTEDMEISEGVETLICACHRCNDVRTYRIERPGEQR